MSGITKMITLLSLVLLGSQLRAAGEVSAKTQCATPANCGTLGSRALNDGRLKEAAALFKMQVELAETSNSQALALQGYNNLAVTSLLSHDRLWALAWTRLALRSDPTNKVAADNLAVIEKELKGLNWPTAATGRYARYAGLAQWNILSVEQRSGRRLGIHFIGIRLNSEWRKSGPSALGELRGVATMDGNKAIYRAVEFSEPCQIDILFSTMEAILTQAGDCGFGYGVYAEGEFQRISFTSKD